MTAATTYQRGQLVRITLCPLRNQHCGLVGEVLEHDRHILCVELPGGARCWTSYVEAVQTEVAQQ